METMSENIILPQSSQKKARPTGVWILTIYALIFAGIAPLLVYIFLLTSGNADIVGIDILWSLPITLGVIASAIGAWKGSNKARKFLLFFVTLHYVLVALNNYWVVSAGDIPIADQGRHWGRVLRGFVNPAVFIWYFNKHTTKEFYN
jgi:hypothetical protein